MLFFKSLLTNFLAVFFVNYLLPNIEIRSITKLPHIRGDLIFPFALALINSLIYPLLRLFSERISLFKIAIISFIVTLSAYLSLHFLPAGITLTRIDSYVWSVLIVWAISFLTSYLERKKYSKQEKKEEE